MTLLDALARMEEVADEVIAKTDALPGDFSDAAFRMARAATPLRLKALIEVARAAEMYAAFAPAEGGDTRHRRHADLQEALKRLEGVLQ
jgi:hypothetical protein